jgi:hypothetical protein
MREREREREREITQFFVTAKFSTHFLQNIFKKSIHTKTASAKSEAPPAQISFAIFRQYFTVFSLLFISVIKVTLSKYKTIKIFLFANKKRAESFY